MLFISFLLLVYTKFQGCTGDSCRWLSLGPISFQTSDVARFSMIIFLASYIDNNYKYGLHSYKIIKSEEITKNVFVCVGTSFIPKSDEKIINLDALHDEVIEIYIKKLST